MFNLHNPRYWYHSPCPVELPLPPRYRRVLTRVVQSAQSETVTRVLDSVGTHPNNEEIH